MYKNFSHQADKVVASIDQVLDELELENNDNTHLIVDRDDSQHNNSITDTDPNNENKYTALHASEEDEPNKNSDNKSSITVDDSSTDSNSKSSSSATSENSSSSNSIDGSSKSSDKQEDSSSTSDSNSNYETNHDQEEDNNMVTNLLSNIELNSDQSDKISTYVKTEENEVTEETGTQNTQETEETTGNNETNIQEQAASLSYVCLNSELITDSNFCTSLDSSLVVKEQSITENVEHVQEAEELKETVEIPVEPQANNLIEDEVAEEEMPNNIKENKSESIEVVKIDEILAEKIYPLEGIEEGSEKKSMAMGFESTMDDISDNELESFLQELEDLEQEQQKQKSCDKSTTEKDTCDNISQASTVDINEPQIESLDSTIKTETADYPIESHEYSDSEIPENQSDVMMKMEDSLASEQTIEEATTSAITNNELASSEVKSIPNQIEPEEDNIVVEEEVALERPKTLDVKPETVEQVDPAKIAQIDSDQGLTSTSSEDFSAPISQSQSEAVEENSDSGKITPNINGIAASQLGRVPPYWVPDGSSTNCMQCNLKFSVIKRRHHCRCCGLLLCSGCCSMKAKLPYLDDAESRVCQQCDEILKRNRSALETVGNGDNFNGNSPRQPNPNNPMEYCSVLPPHQQVSQQITPPMAVMVPVSVLKKRENSSKSERKDKNVIFSDGIRPGCDLSELDENWNMRPSSSGSTSRSSRSSSNSDRKNKFQANLPVRDERNKSYVPAAGDQLPPIYCCIKTEFKFIDVVNDESLIERLKTEELKFAVQRNFYVFCKIIKLTCCINKTVINFTTEGMHHKGQDEIVILLELEESKSLPKDIFLHLNDIYNDTDEGKIITEYGYSLAKGPNFLNSKDCGGFIYIRPSFQCLQSLHLPPPPYLFGILIHRYEINWARVFPLRLVLRLGALYRYYPSPLVSVCSRNTVYYEIGQTIMNFLADFRTFSYTIETVRGLNIHMEDRKTSVLIPKNRYDSIIKVINNSSDHILAFGGDFSRRADGHLVCIQNIENLSETLSYSTQAINIQGQPRKVTAACFFILNGALKQNSGLSGKCSIVEDGLMVQITSTKMTSIRDSLKSMKNIEIVCGPVDATDEKQTEIVSIEWIENDMNFNVGVLSPIDKKPMNGIPSIRVHHHGLDMSNKFHIIRWTEVFIIKSDEEISSNRSNRSINEDQINISKISEQIARSTSVALINFLDLLATNGMTKIGLRVTLDVENVSYEAGSSFTKFPPLYMNALDNELIGALHRLAVNLDSPIILELIFYILNK